MGYLMAGLALILAIVATLLVLYTLAVLGAHQARNRSLQEQLGLLRDEIQELRDAEAVRMAASRTPAAPARQESVHVPLQEPVAMSPALVMSALLRPAALDTSLDAAEAMDLPLADHMSAVAGSGGRHQQQPQEPLMKPLIDRLHGTEEWEALIGTRWMNRVGAVALILGMGFFFKYAVDNNWISQGLRVLIGVLVGAGLLALAQRAHSRQYQVFAQGLVGAGIVILYFAVYASANAYHLIPQPIALIGMAVVTGLALAQGLYYRSLFVALLGWAGGFLSLALLGLGTGNELGVVGFVALLDAGLLAILFLRDDWFILEPLTMTATYITYIAWYGLGAYSSSQLALAVGALTLFWAMFLALDLLRIAKGVGTHSPLRHIMGSGNAVAYYGLLFLLMHDHTDALGVMTLAAGAVYIGTILFVRRELRADDRLDARYTVTAIVLGAVAAPILLSGLEVVMVWSLEALALLWLGTRRQLPYIWQPAVLLFGVASAYLLAQPRALAYSPIGSFLPLVNERGLAFAVLIVCLATSSLVVHRLQHRRVSGLESLVHYGWSSALFLLITVETNDIFRRAMVGGSPLTISHLEFARSLTIAAVWMIYSLPLVWWGLRRANTAVLSAGLATSALATGLGVATGWAYQPIAQYAPVVNIRVGTLLLLIGGLGLHYRMLRQHKADYPWIGTMLAGYQAAIVLVGFEIVTVEIHDYFRHASGAVSERAGNSGLFIELMTLAAVWMLYSFPLVRYGIRSRGLTILLIGLGALGASISAGAVAAISYEPGNWLSLAISMRPIILIGLGIGLFFQMRWIRSARRTFEWLNSVLLALQVATVLLGFELVSAQTRDIFHYHIATVSSGDADTWKNLEQLAFSLVWLAYAMVLLGIGLWRRTRWLRLGSMALLGLAVLKIFIYDLAFLSPALRSISFVGLGVILLAVSFLYQRFRGLLLDVDAPEAIPAS
ncbi:MAG TPA: DUF2339 domain-containing protein [Chloroflexota bacterium]